MNGGPRLALTTSILRTAPGGKKMKALAPKLFAVLLLLSGGPFAKVQAKDDPWAPFGFLIGEWIGEGKEGQGQFSLAPDLQGKVLVRRNHAELPAADGRPAGVHDDLMVIYKSPDGKSAKAIYFDSEDHVINYSVTLSDDKETLTFISGAAPGAPRFRLTYRKEAEDRVGIKFEIATPGKPEEFKMYLEGKARKKSGK
jgi:hypothetical protein